MYRNEWGYLRLISDILQQGHEKEDRTGVGTIGLHGVQMKFDVSKNFPLLLSKEVPFKSVLGELLWFLEGSISDKRLSVLTHGVEGKKTIWTDNIKAWKYEDNAGMIYGKQWRDFNGVDQIKNVEKMLKEDPSSRRILVSAWNPAQLGQMCLPPCHYSFQLITNGKKLDMIANMRSADIGLGVPFNIASYSLLLEMFAAAHGFHPNVLTLNLGDAHIYKNHIEPLKEQLSRRSQIHKLTKPWLSLSKKDSVLDYGPNDVMLHDYNPLPKIKMEMAV